MKSAFLVKYRIIDPGTLGKNLRRRRRSSGSVSLRPSCSAPSLIPSPCQTLVSPETSPRHPVPASWPAYATMTSATPMMGQPQEREVSQWPSRRYCALVYSIGKLSDRTFRFCSDTIETKCVRLNCLI